MNLSLSRVFAVILILISLPLAVYGAGNLKQLANVVEQFTEKNSSGVVRIGVLYSDTISFPDPILDEKTGGWYSSEKQAQFPVQVAVTGSGFLVNTNGYIVTNAHVIDTDNSRLESGILWDKFTQERYDNIYNFLKERNTQDIINVVYGNLIDYIAQYGQWKGATYQIAVLNPDNKYDNFSDYITHGYIAEIKKAGEPYPLLGKDIAVIKIEPNPKFNPVTLGDSAKVKLGGNIYVMGYPGTSDITKDSINKPTITSGIVSSIKKADTGDYNLIQIDAAISEGNSGGPVFDDSGNVIGIATLKTEGKDSYNFILPVELAKEYLSELNVSVMTAQPSLFALPLFHNQWFYIGIIGALIILAILSAIIIWYRRRKILSISPQAPSNSPTPVLSAQVPNIVTPAPVESPVASAAEPSKSIPLSQPKQSTPPTQTEENAR